jgi:hypothetical protein
VKTPLGYNAFDNTNVMGKLKKALYNLKQSSRARFKRFWLAMKKYNYN